MGFEPITLTILMQCSANWANKPTGIKYIKVHTEVGHFVNL